MITPFESFSTLLVSLLVLTCLSAPVAPTVPLVSRQAQTAQDTMPDGLMSALLATSSQPFEASADGYRARSGGLDFTLRASGLQAESNGLSLNLALSGLGRSEKIAALPEAVIAQTDSRLEYRRGTLTEWYRDTPLGVEQGFTIYEAPRGAGPLVLQLALSTDLAGAPDGDGRGLSFAATDGQALRYDHLRAWDASGAPLDATLHYVPGQVRIQVHDRGATYPIMIDPLIYREQKVIASGAANDNFGWSVALDGDTALVGAYREDTSVYANQGAVYVFVRSGTTWSLQQELFASDGGASDQFGNSVALDGDTALVGAYTDDVSTNGDQGAVYVFVRSGTTWSQQQKLTASGGAEGDQFGSSVALSGETTLVGAWYDDVGANSDQGSAYVFVRSGTTWTQQGGPLTATGGAAGDHLGSSVALSGNTALVGAHADDVSASNQGAAYVFTRSGTTWTQQAQLTASDGAANDEFGSAVALDGDTALVGAWYDDVGGNNNQGSAYVFVRSGTTWTQQAHLIVSDGTVGDWFGLAVALDGDTALVGAPADNVGAGSDQGSAYVFTRSGTTWTLQQQLTASDGAASDWFGRSVALSGDGTALVGAWGDNIGANADQGAAHVFTRSGTAWKPQQKLTASDGESGDQFGYSVALSGDTALVGAWADDVATDSQGSAYIFARSGSGTTWSLQQKLAASDGAIGDQFGYSVALVGDTALVGVPWDDVGANDDQGSAYVFTRSGTTWTQQKHLTATTSTAGDWFGSSVALDDDTALVGAPRDTVGANNGQGSAYVFTRSGTTWTQQAQLVATEGAAGDDFGWSVALDGDTALVGAPYAEVEDSFGTAFVFTRSGTTWTQQAYLIPSGTFVVGYFGWSVALSGDTALVGSPGDQVGANSSQGAAYVFTRSGTTWSPQQRLTTADGAEYDEFGISVALDGDTALLGAYHDDIAANEDQGSAYIFTRGGTTWSSQAKLIASDGAAWDEFGWSVALSGDGNGALVGAYLDDIGANNNQGSVYFYYESSFKIYLPLVLRNTS